MAIYSNVLVVLVFGFSIFSTIPLTANAGLFSAITGLFGGNSNNSGSVTENLNSQKLPLLHSSASLTSSALGGGDIIIVDNEAEAKKPSEVIKFIIKETGLELELQRGNDEDKERLENMRELATLATKYDYMAKVEGIEKLLEEFALASDQDSLIKNENAVKLMTIHASKGLEFDYVFITGLEQDLFPHQAVGKEEKTPQELEEERRLFYVALTRARKKLFLTYAEMRTIFGSMQMNLPSEFFADFDNNFLQEEKFEFREKIIYLEW